MTVDLSRTIAITADGDASSQTTDRSSLFPDRCRARSLTIKPDGEFIGRDGGSSQIVIADPRISKRHVWIGVKKGA